jgi:hypothetical protein
MFLKFIYCLGVTISSIRYAPVKVPSHNHISSWGLETWPGMGKEEKRIFGQFVGIV